MYSIKKRDDLENINKLFLLEKQVKAVRLQDKLGKQNFHEDMRKVFEPVTDIVKDVSNDLTKTMTETSFRSNRALTNLNDKLLEIKVDRGKLTSCLLFLLSKITNPEHTSQLKLVRDPDSKRFNHLLMEKPIPVTLYDNLLTFPDKNKQFEVNGDLLKMILNEN